jgi:hypothetical protein
VKESYLSQQIKTTGVTGLLIGSMLKQYFILQFKMINRKFSDSGVWPVMGYFISCIIFTGLSVYLFAKTEQAVYVYTLAAVMFAGRLSETRRNEFLKICFGDFRLKQIRMLENMLAVTPFLLFLCFKQLWLIALLVSVLSVLLALASFSTSLNFSIPTPFYNRPFEFTVGFRNTFYLFLVAYVLAGIAAGVGNFNLCIFALLLVFAVTLSYYANPENEYYVWSHSCSPTQFLIGKLKTALLYVTLLVLPVLFILGVAFVNQVPLALLFLVVGYAFLACIVLAKYSAYPSEMSLPQGLVLALCIWFPPALLIVIPYFFNRSTTRLQHLLK